MFLKLIYILIFLSIISLSWSCKESEESSDEKTINYTAEKSEKTNQDSAATTVRTRIKTLTNFHRIDLDINSFGSYLRNLKLKPAGTLVKFYDGRVKPNNNVYDAVVDLDIGTKDLHQCADAVMRLRAEFLWSQEQYDKIHFNFTNGHKVEYSEWMNGKRMNVQGNKTWWSPKAEPSNSYQDFWKYMELIFTYAGTASLKKELKFKEIEDAKIGDVLIQGGYPGHAVILIDQSVNEETGEKIFLLAQSYMPAQEIQLLKNPMDPSLSPWYNLDKDEIRTPEWSFNRDDLRSFKK
jgi:hypothetical protein